MLTAKEVNNLFPRHNIDKALNKISNLIQQRAENGYNQVNLCNYFRYKAFFNFDNEWYRYGTELNSTGSKIYNTLIKNGYEVDISQYEDENPDFIVKW